MRKLLDVTRPQGPWQTAKLILASTKKLYRDYDMKTFQVPPIDPNFFATFFGLCPRALHLAVLRKQ